MSDVTQILSKIKSGDQHASSELLPLVYDELRKLAAAKMAYEKPGQTLQATALVHDAYLRLVDVKRDHNWNSRGHFFSAAAEAMRRILIEAHRRKQAQKHGGAHRQVELAHADLGVDDLQFDILDLSDAVERLADLDMDAAEIAKLRIFAGLSVDEAAKSLAIPHTTAYRQWTYAQAWLCAAMDDAD